MSRYDIDLNTYKCSHCGLYFKGYDIESHEKSCHLNPDNQEES